MRNLPVEQAFTLAFNVVRAIRAIRMQYSAFFFNVFYNTHFPLPDLKTKTKVFLRLATEGLVTLFTPFLRDIGTLSQSETVTVIRSNETPPVGCAVSIVDKDTEVHLLLVGVVNADEEIARLVRISEESISFFSKVGFFFSL